MAELSVTGALISVEMVISLLKQRLHLKNDVIEEVERIKSWLETLQAFIMYHDEDRAVHSKWLDRHVEKVRTIAKEIEDVIEEFELHSQHVSHGTELAQKASEFFHDIKHYVPLNDTFHKITAIKRKIGDFIEQHQIIKDINVPGSGTRTRVLVNPLNFDDPDVNNKLSSVYKDLPSDLKSCFLYLSIFPQGYDIDCGRLVRLWVAEKFANERDGKTAENVAEEFLNELILWNLVEVSRRYSDGHPPRHCRVHNLVLKFIFNKCEEENFISIISKQSSRRPKLRRHLSVQSACTCSSGNTKEPAGRFKNLVIRGNSRACRCWSRDRDFSDVRSLFIFGSDNDSVSITGNRFQDFKLLKVIDLEGSSLTEFPKRNYKLTLVRYLSLRDTKVKAINDRSIKKLGCLETLDLKQTNVTELPKKIWRLKKLRHLLAGRKTANNFADSDSVQGVKGIENLTNLQKLSFEKTVKIFADFDSVQGVKVFEGVQKTDLQTLSRIDAGQNGKIIKELKHLSQLKKLGLTGLKKEFGRDLCESIKQMRHLTTLDLCASTKEDYLELGDLDAEPPLSLQRLYLKGRLEKFPDWISSLKDLFCLRLKYSRLQDSPLNSLKNLPNLVELHLVDCFAGEDSEELTFKTSSFNQIKKLVIDQFSELHTIKFVEGVMPGLQQISLSRCPKLEMPPLGINKLSKVEELTLYDMNQDFIASIRRVGEDRAMVQHIRVIHSFTLNGQSWSVENLSHSSTL